MSKCTYCGTRKGKRACPALNGVICSQCCGQHRVARIACPPDCIYLNPNSEYQQKRAGNRFAYERRELYQELFALGGEKAARLFTFIEVATFSYFHDRRDGQDGEIIAALQSLRRSLSPLHLPEGPQPVFAEHLKKEYEAFVRQPDAPDARLGTEVLDRALKFVSEFSGSGLQSQRFLTGLTGYIRTYHPEVAEQLTKQAQGSVRIILPGDVPLGLTPTAPVHPHSHSHHHAH